MSESAFGAAPSSSGHWLRRLGLLLCFALVSLSAVALLAAAKVKFFDDQHVSLLGLVVVSCIVGAIVAFGVAKFGRLPMLQKAATAFGPFLIFSVVALGTMMLVYFVRLWLDLKVADGPIYAVSFGAGALASIVGMALLARRRGAVLSGVEYAGLSAWSAFLVWAAIVALFDYARFNFSGVVGADIGLWSGWIAGYACVSVALVAYSLWRGSKYTWSETWVHALGIILMASLAAKGLASHGMLGAGQRSLTWLALSLPFVLALVWLKWRGR